MGSEAIISSVKYWLEHTIIGFNFCPFAKKEFVNDRIHYEVVDESNREEMMLSLVEEFSRLDKQPSIETTLVIFPIGLESFFDYLDFVELANQINDELNNNGIYQIASFHPDYYFADVPQNDVSNYTNRSPFPIIHIIREQTMENALDKHPDPDSIPEINIAITQQQGVDVFKKILVDSIKSG